MKLRVMFLVIGLLLSSTSYAGEVARGEIDELVNLIGNERLFAVFMSTSSSGPCAGKWVRFKEANFGNNPEGYKFAFSMAATALASGKKVRLHNYLSDSCDGVTFIGVSK
ncbi:DUF5992 family protein [Photobacterium sp.]|uniref:DUF5992 family protein n=1 Tax=Photobacterium sp. TaxID=660 RepID=UPI00299DDC96|nr:DUF5992 family protein [Photobacterium sp.]MDX1303030.1 DUF5992 family protein [Photobacterium sp.]